MYCDTQCALTSQEKPSGKFCFPGMNIRKYSLFCLLLLIMIFTGVRTVSAADMVARAKKNGKTVAKGKIVTDSKGVRYRFSKDKTYAENKWLEIDGVVYYFNSKGYAKTGWFTYRDETYYAGPKGRIYYSRWLTKKDKKYYLQSDGTMIHNKFMIKNGKKYRFTTKGVLVTYRMYEIRGKWYYSRKDGTLITSSWLSTTSGKRYYFDQDGVRLSRQWVFYRGKFYYLKKDGTMAVNKKIGKYKVGEDGARIISSKNYLFVGDSRVVGMSNAVSSSEASFVGKVSMGYSWMVSSALSQVKSKLKSEPTLYVIFCFGINDLGNIDKYISEYRKLISSYKYANFFFMSVNPIETSKARANGYSVTNSQIEAFNEKLKEAMGFRYLNTYKWMTKKGFDTADGIHYTSSTYSRLYSYAVQAMG